MNLFRFSVETGKVTRIGATLQFIKETSQVIIREPLPNSAAEKAGLKRGDVILAVNGKKTKGKKLPEIAYEVRGPAGESVKLKILRDEEILNLKVVRENIKLRDVEGAKVDSSTAFISIDGFSSRTVDEVAEKLKSLDDPKLTKLILDLRNNTGGGEGLRPDVEVKEGKIVAHTSDLKVKISEDAAFRAALHI